MWDAPEFEMPFAFDVKDNMIVPPAPVKDMNKVEVLRGPNIKPFPEMFPLKDSLAAKCSLKVGDNITTDHIMPAGAKILPLRSNIPAISMHCFTAVDEYFPERALECGESVIVGGLNYGQGSSREHAALAPMYLGIKAVIVKSFARIHRANLINAGILPLVFKSEADYDSISQGDKLVFDDLKALVNTGFAAVTNKKTNAVIEVLCPLSQREKGIVLRGGLLGTALPGN
jgi:aconitate hydratase